MCLPVGVQCTPSKYIHVSCVSYKRTRTHFRAIDSKWTLFAFPLYVCDVWTLRLVSTASICKLIVVVLVHVCVLYVYFIALPILFSHKFLQLSFIPNFPYYLHCYSYSFCFYFPYLHPLSLTLHSLCVCMCGIQKNIESTYLNKNFVVHFLFIAEQKFCLLYTRKRKSLCKGWNLRDCIYCAS